MAKEKSPMSSSSWGIWTKSEGKPHVHSPDDLCHLIHSATVGTWGLVKVLSQGHLSPTHQTPHKVAIQNPHQDCQEAIQSNRCSQGARPWEDKGECCRHRALPATAVWAGEQHARPGADAKEPRQAWSGKAAQLTTLLEMPKHLDSLILLQETYSTETLPHAHTSTCKSVLITAGLVLVKRRFANKCQVIGNWT